MVRWDHFNVMPKGATHSFTIIKPAGEGLFEAAQASQDRTVIEICSEWELNMCQPYYQLCHSITEWLNLITCPFLALIGFSHQDSFKPLWLTILPLRARNHSAHVSKYAPREWLLLLLLLLSNCLHRTSFVLNRRNGEELVKQTESFMVWFKLLREWKCMSVLVSLVKSMLV